MSGRWHRPALPWSESRRCATKAARTRQATGAAWWPSTLRLAASVSFQVPAFENQRSRAQYRQRVYHRVGAVVGDELPADSGFMGHLADNIQRRKIRDKVGRGGCHPAGQTVAEPGKAAKVLGKAAN